MAEGLIDADVELHLAGASQPTSDAHLEHLSDLVALADGLPVTFHLDATKEALSGLYGEAALYWHAAGYGADLQKEPGRAEHFGIAIVEAMSAECVPVVFAAGGPTEIVTHGVDGFLFSTEDELVDLTATAMSASFRTSRVDMGRAARKTHAKYSLERFTEKALAYLG